MKIGLMVYEPLKDQSGGYLYDRKIVEYLKDRRYEVLVYTFPFEISRVIKDDVELLIEDKLCHEDLLEFNLHLKRAFPIPVIALVHYLEYLEPGSKKEKTKEKEKEFLKTCDAVIVNSAGTSNEVRKLKVELLTLIAYPGCDHFALPSEFKRKVPQKFLELLSVGNLIPSKGFHLLLDALGGLSDYPWELRIVGNETVDVRYIELLRKKARKFGNRVQFLGQVSPKELSEIYLDSDLFILPSYFEGYGMVVAEAVLHFLPVIASRVGGIPEIIQNGREGILIPPGDKSALKQALQDFLEHHERLEPFIEACARRRSSLPTWHETGKLIDNFLLRFRHGYFRA
jgi:glycosyltransferase involved in cell wall biosynthesis